LIKIETKLFVLFTRGGGVARGEEDAAPNRGTLLTMVVIVLANQTATYETTI